MYDVVVIGGGAAGMLASAVAAENGVSVMLLERNAHPGKKLKITGKGRCNLTNNCSITEVLESIPTGGQFLHSSLNAFSPQDTMELFGRLGVPLKTERGNRVFPQSDSAGDVVGALIRFMDDSGVERKQGRALGVVQVNGRVTSVETADGMIECGTAILATGGLSYPATGSTGDGYDISRNLGHTIAPLRGSLVPLEAEPEICGKMQGLTLRNVRLSVYCGGKKPIFDDFGELLFTHFGISGPLALSASAHMRDFEHKEYYVLIDFKPALDEKKLDLRVLRDFEKYSNRNFANSLGSMLARLSIPVIVSRSGIPPDMKVHSINRDQRQGLVRLLKGFRIEISCPRPVEEAIITSGGVDLREINPKTMESKLVHGLYFAGEIIDADAYTGGFNLQIAWSTAVAAGKAAAKAARDSMSTG